MGDNSQTLAGIELWQHRWLNAHAYKLILFHPGIIPVHTAAVLLLLLLLFLLLLLLPQQVMMIV